MPDNPALPSQREPGQGGSPPTRPRPLAVALAWATTLIAAVVVIGGAALLTAGRLPGSLSSQRDAPAAEQPTARRPEHRTEPAAADQGTERLAGLLRFLARAQVADAASADDEDAATPDPDVAERLRAASQMAAIFPDRGPVDVPDDLPLGEGWRVLASVPAGAVGDHDTLLLIRAPQGADAVVAFLRDECAADGWSCEVRPRKDDSTTLVLRRRRSVRMATVRSRAGGAESVIAVLDAPD